MELTDSSNDSLPDIDFGITNIQMPVSEVETEIKHDLVGKSKVTSKGEGWSPKIPEAKSSVNLRESISLLAAQHKSVPLLVHSSLKSATFKKEVGSPSGFENRQVQEMKSSHRNLNKPTRQSPLGIRQAGPVAVVGNLDKRHGADVNLNFTVGKSSIRQCSKEMDSLTCIILPTLCASSHKKTKHFSDGIITDCKKELARNSSAKSSSNSIKYLGQKSYYGFQATVTSSVSGALSLAPQSAAPQEAVCSTDPIKPAATFTRAETNVLQADPSVKKDPQPHSMSLSVVSAPHEVFEADKFMIKNDSSNTLQTQVFKENGEKSNQDIGSLMSDKGESSVYIDEKLVSLNVDEDKFTSRTSEHFHRHAKWKKEKKHRCRRNYRSKFRDVQTAGNSDTGATVVTMAAMANNNADLILRLPASSDFEKSSFSLAKQIAEKNNVVRSVVKDTVNMQGDSHPAAATVTSQKPTFTSSPSSFTRSLLAPGGVAANYKSSTNAVFLRQSPVVGNINSVLPISTPYPIHLIDWNQTFPLSQHAQASKVSYTRPKAQILPTFSQAQTPADHTIPKTHYRTKTHTPASGPIQTLPNHTKQELNISGAKGQPTTDGQVHTPENHTIAKLNIPQVGPNQASYTKTHSCADQPAKSSDHKLEIQNGVVTNLPAVNLPATAGANLLATASANLPATAGANLLATAGANLLAIAGVNLPATAGANLPATASANLPAEAGAIGGGGPDTAVRCSRHPGLEFGVQKVLEVFPGLDRRHVEDLLVGYLTNYSLDQAINMAVDRLLDGPAVDVFAHQDHLPGGSAIAVRQQQPQLRVAEHIPQDPVVAGLLQQPEIKVVQILHASTSRAEKRDFYKQYSEASNIPTMQAADKLGSEFRNVRMTTINTILKRFNGHYAPAHRCISQAFQKAMADLDEKRKNGNAVEKQPTFLTVTFHEGQPNEENIQFLLMKGPRPKPVVQLPHTHMHPELKAEIEFIQQRMLLDREEKDRKFAWSLLEEEYEAEGQSIECGCCYVEQPFENLVQCFDGHLYCCQCLMAYAREAVFGCAKLPLGCMTSGCDSTFPKNQLVKALPEDIMEKYDERMAEESLSLAAMVDLVRCPKCNFAFVLDQRIVILQCPNIACRKATCRLCKEDWSEHVGKTCEQIEKKDETRLRTGYEEKMTAARVRECVTCRAQFFKEEGCNKMTCRCGTTMCYICRQPKIAYNHFCQHLREPGRNCSQCKKCFLWSNPAEDEQRAIAEIQKEAQEKRKQQGFLDQKLIGVPEEPPLKKLKA